MVFCGTCGTSNDDQSQFCYSCGSPIDGPAKPDYQSNQYQQNTGFVPNTQVHGSQPYSQTQYYPNQPRIIRIGKRKDPVLAAVISLFLPGLGYAYIDEVGKGIGFFILIIFTYFLVVGFIIHIYTIIDSYNQTKYYNQKMGYYG